MKILTDCAADMSAEETEYLDITVVPLYIQFPEGEVKATDISADEFYRRLEDMQPNIPTTAQPSAGLIGEIYRSFIEKGEEIISIHISSGLSGTINSAHLAAQQMATNLVHVVDTMTLSGGERFQVLAAAWAVKAGWRMPELLKRLEEIRNSTEVIYTLDTLKYLAHGGRIGRVQALAGSLLGIKPIITVEHGDGKYSTLGKTRTIPRALEAISDHLAKKFGKDMEVWVSVIHGKFEEQAIALTDLLQQKLNIGKLEMIRISPVLGVHTGPSIVGASVVPMSLMNDFDK